MATTPRTLIRPLGFLIPNLPTHRVPTQTLRTRPQPTRSYSKRVLNLVALKTSHQTFDQYTHRRQTSYGSSPSHQNKKQSSFNSFALPGGQSHPPRHNHEGQIATPRGSHPHRSEPNIGHQHRHPSIGNPILRTGNTYYIIISYLIRLYIQTQHLGPTNLSKKIFRSCIVSGTTAYGESTKETRNSGWRR